MLAKIIKDNFFINNLKSDIPAGIAVFFVAVPLCLGIASASGAPLFSGLISGVVGGIVVALISNSQLSVSGPAAGLTAIAISGISQLGSFEAFLTAVFLAGVLQILFGIIKAGVVAKFIPANVINGMLSGIGVILIIKQLPQLLGYNGQIIGINELLPKFNNINTAPLLIRIYQKGFNALIAFYNSLHMGVLIIGFSAIVFLFAWEYFIAKRLKTIPGALPVVVFAVILKLMLDHWATFAPLSNEFLVQIPEVNSAAEFKAESIFPNLSVIFTPPVYMVGITIAVVASVETLLSLEAIDKIDPLKRVSKPNRELIAQGVGNTICGLVGGLPITAVIVRGSVNVSAGAKSKISAIVHGILLAGSVLYFSNYLNQIPLAALAAILIYTGYKLVNPAMIITQFKAGLKQFIPYATTLVAVVLTDLLIGVLIGIAVNMVFDKIKPLQQ